MRVAIYCDPLMGVGGAARVVAELSNSLNADIITSGVNYSIIKSLKIKRKVINIGNISIKFLPPIGYFFEAPIRFLFSKNYKYDLYVFTGSYSIYAARKKNKNVWFCFTPNRFMYDLKEWKIKNSGVKGIMFWLHAFLFNSTDQRIVKNNITMILSQTENIHARVKKYYGRDSEIVYSPLDTKKFRFEKYGNYYLAVSRLMKEKRMDLIAEAFTEMKDKNLILVGDGPEKSNILKIIHNHKNIHLLSKTTDEELIKLYASCFAVIYMPVNEDFGLVPLEAMASGKICIAADEGGCKETIIDKKTGYLIKPSKKEIIDVVSNLTQADVEKMKTDCLERSKFFDRNLWEERVNKTIKINLNDYYG